LAYSCTPIVEYRLSERDEFEVVDSNQAYRTVFGGDPGLPFQSGQIDRRFSTADSPFSIDSLSMFALPVVDVVDESRHSRFVVNMDQTGSRRFYVCDRVLDDGGHVVEIYQDVTTSARLRERIGVLTRMFRHDLRNQVNVIAGWTETIDSVSDRQQVSESIGRVKTAADRLSDITSAVTAHRNVITNEEDVPTADISAVAASEVDTIQKQHTDATVNYRSAVDSDTSVIGGNLVSDLVGELLDNSIMHSMEPTTVDVILDTVQGSPIMQLVDNGSGMPENEAAILQSGGSVGKLTHSSGFGLWISRWISDAIGAQIDVLAANGVGTSTVIQFRAPPLEQGSYLDTAAWGASDDSESLHDRLLGGLDTQAADTHSLQRHGD
jgi:signal transduction histidine kinase